MKKVAKYDRLALGELKSFDVSVQRDIVIIIGRLEREGRLKYPDGKKITKEIFEVRLKRDGAYRGFYAYIQGNLVIILHFFRKKSQKTPTKDLKLAEKRLQKYV